MAALCPLAPQPHVRAPHRPVTSAGSRSSARTAVTAHASGGAERTSLRLPVTKPTLVDMPVSNHGSRVRHIIYHKGIEADFDIVTPMAVGGLGSQQYAALNPQGKMPILLLPDGHVLPESEVISQYVLDAYGGCGPSMRADTPELRAVAALAARIHDVYITPIQACMYRKMEAPERAAGLAQLVKQLDVLEGLCVGPFVAGNTITSGDSALLGTFVFLTFILPRYFGWRDVFAGRPKLAAWWAAMQADPCARRVIDEVAGGLEAWAAKNRWEDLGIVQQLQDNRQLQWAY